MSGNTNIKLLIEGCLNKNVLSEKRLFELYYGYIMSVCNRYASDKQQAEEMLNDTFYTTFKYLDRYDQALPFNPWLRKVCVNCCLQHIRKQAKHKPFEILAETDHLYEILDDTDLLDMEDSAYLRLVQLLPAAYKMVFNLYVFEEYKHHEIAELLGISVGTSKSNLSRAKTKIKILIQEMNVNPQKKKNHS